MSESISKIIQNTNSYRQEANVNAVGFTAGGIVGYNVKGSVVNCYNTGRISSTEPNLQNIPTHDELGKNIKKAFRI